MSPPFHVTVWPAGLLIVQPAKFKPWSPGLSSIPPSTFSAPGPERVPEVRVTSPLTVRLPDPVRVPPVSERVLSIVEAAAIDSVPPESVSGSDEVRLLIESLTLLE